MKAFIQTDTYPKTVKLIVDFEWINFVSLYDMKLYSYTHKFQHEFLTEAMINPTAIVLHWESRLIELKSSNLWQQPHLVITLMVIALN